MTRRSPHYLASAGPVNARRDPPAGRSRGTRAGHDSGTHGAANHALRHACRAQLGPGLRRQLRPAQPWTAAADSRMLRALMLLLALGALPFAALQELWFAFAAGCVAVGGWLALRLHARGLAARGERTLSALELAAFDRRLADAAVELSEVQRELLREIKARIVPLAGDPAAQESPAAIEARVYAERCVRRVLPEALESFLALPPALRDARDDEASAGDKLTRVLEAVRAELEARRFAALRAMRR